MEWGGGAVPSSPPSWRRAGILKSAGREELSCLVRTLESAGGKNFMRRRHACGETGRRELPARRRTMSPCFCEALCDSGSGWVRPSASHMPSELFVILKGSGWITQVPLLLEEGGISLKRDDCTRVCIDAWFCCAGRELKEQRVVVRLVHCGSEGGGGGRGEPAGVGEEVDEGFEVVWGHELDCKLDSRGRLRSANLSSVWERARARGVERARDIEGARGIDGARCTAIVWEMERARGMEMMRVTETTGEWKLQGV